MAKVPSNADKPWSAQDRAQLSKLAEGNTPTRLIAHKMGRSENSIRNKASAEGLSLKPVNQSPYNRRDT
jgi:hypothetical protein